MTQETKPDAAKVAQNIDTAKSFQTFQFEAGSAFGIELADALRKLGWKYHDPSSKCRVASYEQHLKKGNLRVEIISSQFAGVFTQIEVYPL